MKVQRAVITVEYEECDPEVESLLFRLSQAALFTQIQPQGVSDVAETVSLPFAE